MSNSVKICFLQKKLNQDFNLGPISVEIFPGQVLGVTGPNGSGKSTFFKLVSGLIRPDSGIVSILGIKDPEKYRSHMGISLERLGFDLQLTGKQNLKILTHIKGLDVNAYKLAAKKVGIDEDLNKRVKDLSFGMQKRLGIATALLGDPEVILLDEPTNGLDILSIAHLRLTITSLAHEGKIIIFSSHIIEDLEKLCTHLIIINKGKVIAQGLKSSLLPFGYSLEKTYLSFI